MKALFKAQLLHSKSHVCLQQVTSIWSGQNSTSHFLIGLLLYLLTQQCVPALHLIHGDRNDHNAVIMTMMIITNVIVCCPDYQNRDLVID